MAYQGDFFKKNREFAPGRISHGDDSCIGKRKLARPFKRHCAIHLVLKSDVATGPLNMLNWKNKVVVDQIIAEQSKKFGVKIHSHQNVGNHIHCIASAGIKENFTRFLKAVAGLIAKAILPGGVGRFWTKPPFTRLINGKRDFTIVSEYIAKNRVEAESGKAARIEIEEQEELVRKARRREIARRRRGAT